MYNYLDLIKYKWRGLELWINILIVHAKAWSILICPTSQNNSIPSLLCFAYIDYKEKLRICEILPSKHGDSGEMGLHNIRAEFYLDTKKKEMDFKENILKGLALEMDKKVNQAKQQSDQRFTAVEKKNHSRGWHYKIHGWRAEATD